MRRPGATIIKSSRWPLKDGHRKIQLWIKGTSHAMFPTSSDVLWLYWLFWNILNGDFCCNESLKWIPIPKHLWLQKRYQLQISKHGGETWLHPRWHARNWSKQKTANVSDNPRQADKHTVSIGQYTLCSWFLHGFKWLYFVHGAFANHALKSHSPGSKPKIVLLRFHSWKWQSSVFTLLFTALLMTKYCTGHPTVFYSLFYQFYSVLLFSTVLFSFLLYSSPNVSLHLPPNPTLFSTPLCSFLLYSSLFYSTLLSSLFSLSNL